MRRDDLLQAVQAFGRHMLDGPVRQGCALWCGQARSNLEIFKTSNVVWYALH